MWEESGDRAGFSDPADGAARSEAWLLHQRTSVSGRLNGCLNTQRCVNKGQLTPRGHEGANVYYCLMLPTGNEKVPGKIDI